MSNRKAVDFFFTDEVEYPGELIGQYHDSTSIRIGQSTASSRYEFVTNAIGDGTTDDAAALQATIDQAVAVGGTVILQAGKNYRIGQPLVVAVSGNQATVTIKSSNAPYLTRSTNARITVHYSDGPALVIQRGRRVRVENIEFVGTNSFVATVNSMVDTSVFLVSGSIRDNRYSPQCAIALDPFHSSVASGDRYPALERYYGSTYEFASVGQNSITGCHFRGWNIGIANSTSGTLLGGDGWVIQDCLFDTVQWAYVAGQAQTKGVTMLNCTTTNARAMVNTVTYGQRQGYPPVVVGGSIGASRQMFVLGQSWGTFTCIGLFSETTLSIGVLGSNFASGAPPASFVGCNFDLWASSGADHIDLHLLTFRPTVFVGCTFSFNTGSGTVRIHNGARLTLDSCAFLATCPNDHLPLDVQDTAQLRLRDCQFLAGTANQDGDGVLATHDLASGGTAQLARVSDGVARFTLAGAGAEVEIGDHLSHTTTGYDPALEDPAALGITTATSLGTVTAVVGDQITLSQVPFTVEAQLPLTIGYTRRRSTFDRYARQIVASNGIDVPYPQSIVSNGTAMLARSSFGENVGGTSGVPFVVAGSNVYLQGGGVNRVRVNVTGIGFNGATPAAAPDYTVTNPATRRTIDVSGATLGELREFVGTMAADLIAVGLWQ